MRLLGKALDRFGLRERISPLLIFYIILRLLFRIIGRARRFWLFSYINWETAREFELWWYARFPRFARHAIGMWSGEDQLMQCITGNLFVDIGANFGYFSLLAHKRFTAVYAVEPHPDNIAKLVTYITRNQANNIIPIQLAISDARGELPLHIGVHHSTHSLSQEHALGRDPRRKLKWEGTIKVKTITLEDLLVGIPSVDLVKVDVEGAEWAVLRGAEPIVHKIRRWIVEVHHVLGREQDIPALKARAEAWFTEHGYCCTWLDKNHIYACSPPCNPPLRTRVIL